LNKASRLEIAQAQVPVRILFNSNSVF